VEVLAGLDEIGAYLGLTRRETRRAISDGEIPARRIACRWTSTKRLCHSSPILRGKFARPLSPQNGGEVARKSIGQNVLLHGIPFG